MINVFAIVVTYNGTKWLDKCFKSLLDSAIPLKIIVVDNASTDGIGEEIRKSFPEIELVELSSNLGFGQANNIGIRKAYDSGATHFFLLNQDAWTEPDTIEKIVRHQEENREYGILSPIHLNGAGNALDFNFSTYIIPSKCPELYSDFCLNNIKNRIYEADFVNSAAWLLSRRCIEKVGGFNPSFFQYGEDDNYIHRAHYFGFKVGIYPLGKIFHDRENRNGTAYDEPLEKFKRINLLKYSNPLGKHNIDRDKRQLMISAILQLLQGRIDLYKSYWKQHKLLKEIAPSIKENLSQNRKGVPLCFLDN